MATEMGSGRLGWLVLVTVLCLCRANEFEEHAWFEAEIVHEMNYAVLHPNQTLEARCVAKGFPLPAVYFLNEYIDFDYDPDDLKYSYNTLNVTFAETRLTISDPEYAAYMPGLYCETENEIGFHDNTFLPISRL